MSYAASAATVKPLVRGPGTGSGQALVLSCQRMFPGISK